MRARLNQTRFRASAQWWEPGLRTPDYTEHKGSLVRVWLRALRVFCGPEWVETAEAGGWETAPPVDRASGLTRAQGDSGRPNTGWLSVGFPPIHRASQAWTSQFQWIEFCGVRIQWFSSGKMTRREGRPMAW